MTIGNKQEDLAKKRQSAGALAHALGCLLICFQGLEASLVRAIDALVGGQTGTGLLLVTLHSFKDLCPTFLALCEHKNPDSEHLKKLREIFKTIAPLEDERNKYIHSEYPPSFDANGRPIRLKTTVRKGALRIMRYEVDAQEIFRVVDAINACHAEFRCILEKMHESGEINAAALLNVEEAAQKNDTNSSD